MTPVENNGLSLDRLVEKGFDPHRKRRVPVPSGWWPRWRR